MPRSPFRLPPEWAAQSAVMLTWPHGETDWADDLDAVEGVYVRIAHGIAAREAVLIVCQTNAHRAHVSGLLDRAEVPRQRVVWATSPSNDTWARDHGPLTVIDAAGTARILDFRFNGWGGKLEAGRDDRITGTLHAQGVFGPAKHSKVDLVLEGGAVETDGQGTLLATLSSVMTETRNPGLSLEAIERRLAKLLGIDRFLWLRHGGLSGDDTDGHIDTLARFADPATILHVSCAPQDPDYPEIAAMIRELEGFRTPDGRPYRLVALPAPVDHRDVRRAAPGRQLCELSDHRRGRARARLWRPRRRRSGADDLRLLPRPPGGSHRLPPADPPKRQSALRDHAAAGGPEPAIGSGSCVIDWDQVVPANLARCLLPIPRYESAWSSTPAPATPTPTAPPPPKASARQRRKGRD